MALLECKTLAKRYGEVAALDGIDLSLEAGKVIGLFGAERLRQDDTHQACKRPYQADVGTGPHRGHGSVRKDQGQGGLPARPRLFARVHEHSAAARLLRGLLRGL